MSNTTEKEKPSVRELNFHTDFDENGNLIDAKMQKHFENERKELLGESKTPDLVPDAPPPDPPIAQPPDDPHLPPAIKNP